MWDADATARMQGVEEVKVYKLGSTIQRSGRWTREVSKRIQTGWNGRRRGPELVVTEEKQQEWKGMFIQWQFNSPGHILDHGVWILFCVCPESWQLLLVPSPSGCFKIFSPAAMNGLESLGLTKRQEYGVHFTTSSRLKKKHSQTWDQTTSDVRPQTKKHHISLKNPSDFSLNGLRLKGLRKKQH